MVLDEYPYLREVVRGMDSVLQALVDRYRDRIESIPYKFMINKLLLYQLWNVPFILCLTA